MALSRVTSGTDANTGTLALSCAVGDVIFLQLLNTANSTVPSVPSGYSNAATAITGSDSTNGFGMRGVFKVAVSTTETVPSVTNCTSIVASVYRGADPTTPITNVLGQANGGSSTISYSGVVSYPEPGVSWVITMGVSDAITGNIGSHPPNSNSLVAEYKTGSDNNAVMDSNGPLSSYSFNSKTLDASVPWITKTIVLRAAAAAAFIPKPYARQFQAVNRAGNY